MAHEGGEAGNRVAASCPYCRGVLADSLKQQAINRRRVARLLKAGKHPFVHQPLHELPSEGYPLRLMFEETDKRHGS